MRCPGGRLTKTAPSSFRAPPPPPLAHMCSLRARAHERQSSNATLRHLSFKSNPPPIHTSPPRLPRSCRSGLFLYICQSEICRGGRDREERERGRGRERGRKRWMAGEVLLMCAGPLTLPDRDPDKAVASQSGHR